MDERAREIAKIKARMEELGYNPRSLSMKLFNKPDRIRNLFDGKARNWRGDTYKAIMKELWPNDNNSPVAHSDKYDIDNKLGMFRSIEILMSVLIAKNLLQKNDLEKLFNYQMRDFRARKQPGAAEVMDQLLDFLHSGPPVSTPQASRKSSPHVQGRLKTEKSLEN